MKRKLCYFLCFRVPRVGGQIRWDNPTGGMVMRPYKYLDGMPLADFTIARNLLEERHHCRPDEHLVIAEVFERPEKRLAQQLHNRYEAEMQEFVDLMRCC